MSQLHDTCRDPGQSGREESTTGVKGLEGFQTGPEKPGKILHEGSDIIVEAQVRGTERDVGKAT